MDPRVPDSVRPVLEEYTSLIEEQLSGLVSAFYIVGSIALHGYDQRFSDIDFVAVLDQLATEVHIESLRAVHKSIEQEFARSKLSGSYLQRSDLGHFEHEIQPHPYYQDGKLIEKGYFEINSVTWWILKNHGVALWGPQPVTLPFTVDWCLLETRMHENLNSYWKSWTTRPDAFLTMLSDWGIQWIVLGVLRQFYTFRAHSITTKLAAGEYGLACLPEKWHRLIQEAVNIRGGNRDRLYRSRIIRMLDTVKFLKYIIKVANDTIAKEVDPGSTRI